MSSKASSFLHRNGLSLVLAGLFIAFLGGQLLAGQHAYNAERKEAGQSTVALATYAHTGHFVSATFENWESEFLQMGMYVLLTVSLRQRGSAESRPLESIRDRSRIDAGPPPRSARGAGLVGWLYAHSLSIAFFALFLASFGLHLAGSWRDALEQRAEQGLPPITWSEHLMGSTFWFESFQNWQSEFLAVLAIVVLSIFLRQDGSPESKPVRAPHAQTGT
ncbi:MAG: DUF6766 family protein [Luteimonas sp.]